MPESSRAQVAEVSGAQVLHRTRVALVLAMSAANAIGAAVVVILAVFVVPEPPVTDSGSLVRDNLLLAIGYVVVAVAFGAVQGNRRLSAQASWLPADRTPTPAEAEAALRGPRVLASLMGALWAVAVVVFVLADATRSVAFGIRVGIIIVFGGLATVNVSYLLAERLLRPAATLALSRTQERTSRVQSVAARQVTTWLLATGGPILGLVAIGLANLVGVGDTGQHLSRTIVALGGTGLLVGLLATVVAARATTDPIVSVRRAMDQLADGDLEVQVPVYDATEIGRLQTGFNRLATSARERARLADLFGRHVGVDVARRALEHGIELGGETRDVAVLFVDIVDSTGLAERLPPDQVVELLNGFFTIVVSVVEAAGGFINKFQGDAALAIFGAPTFDPGRHAAALVAGRNLARRLSAEIGPVDSGTGPVDSGTGHVDFGIGHVDFGIGVASGDAVAGNIGSESRHEYTVIGDPVNEAARLTDLAKRLPTRIAVSGATVQRAEGETDAWIPYQEVVLRGRSTMTTVYTLRHHPDPMAPAAPASTVSSDSLNLKSPTDTLGSAPPV